MNKREKIIVIGGGFAGLQFIRNLDSSYFDILLLDKLNHHQFQPLFYQVATSQLEPSSISFPFRKVLQKKKNLQIRLADAHSINSDEKIVSTNIGDFAYDYLVIATGCRTNFFGNEVLAKNAFTLKSTYDAIELRNHVLLMFEEYISSKAKNKDAFLNIVIAGAGPTGVELAGAFSEIKRYILPKDYPGIDFSKLRIVLAEGSQHTLNAMSEKAKLASELYLKKMGVEVKLSVQVERYENELVYLNNGEVIPSKTLIWAAGVTGNMLEGINQSIIQRGNRIKVNRLNEIEGLNSCYALGDIAYMETPIYPNGHPQLANVAINQAKNLARNLLRIKKKKTLREYEYKDLGSMATIGKNKAVVDLPFIKFKGWIAWYVWMFLHLMLILSVKNKLIIFINWAWAYITKDTSLRLILSKTSR